MRHLRLISAGLFFICSSCGIILQNSGTKNFKDPITKTSEYKSLNKFQQDFLYLSVVCNKYFPYVDKYFSKDRRQIAEREMLKKLESKGLSDLEFKIGKQR